MRFIRKLISFILIVALIAGGFCFIQGKQLYDKKLSEISLEDKVNSIKSSESFVSISSLPDYYKNAVIAVEDHRFREHSAVDIIAICRAIVSNFKQKEFAEGGSTITQQTAKNLYFITSDNVVSRKMAEIILGYELEKNILKMKF